MNHNVVVFPRAKARTGKRSQMPPSAPLPKVYDQFCESRKQMLFALNTWVKHHDDADEIRQEIDATISIMKAIFQMRD